MFFVFYPIDIIFLDSTQRVIDLKEHFSPFHFYTSQYLAKYVIELPSGTIARTYTKQGDHIQWRGSMGQA